ncbi:MAG: hypothetical protein JOZ57_07160, partial [Abitibacteriaceae bacterium]|nr:hypothetical protein [Abditibacteriaceae bacterium]
MNRKSPFFKSPFFSNSFFIVLSCMMAFCFAPSQAWSQSGTPQPTPGATPGATPGPTPVGTPVPPGFILPTPTPFPGPGCTNYTLTASTGATIDPGTFSTGVQADTTQLITLPFPYTLYDETFTTATISSHGNIQFQSSAINPYGPCLPDPLFDHTIFAYHTHLHTSPFAGVGLITDGVYTSVTGAAPNRIFNLEWRTHDYNFFGVNNVGTYENFEIRLYENVRRFDIIYGTMEDGGIDGIVGVQRNANNCYTQYSCHGGGVFPGLMLSFAGQDLLPPSVFITTPAPGATIPSLPEISGEAQDNFGGSG